MTHVTMARKFREAGRKFERLGTTGRVTVGNKHGICYAMRSRFGYVPNEISNLMDSLRPEYQDISSTFPFWWQEGYRAKAGSPETFRSDALERVFFCFIVADMLEFGDV